MTIRQTSLNAYRQLEANNELGSKQIEVLNTFRTCGNMTDLEISAMLGWPINQVTGRRNELVKAEYVNEKGLKLNRTGRKAIVWGII
jgi:DNA-binding MarR family transcriptional regulator